MGTNYYAVKRVSDIDKENIISLIRENKLVSANEMLNDLVTSHRIHIGKSSYGWKFVFNHNNEKYYDLNRDSIDKFLRLDDVILYDEYNREVSINEFWTFVDLKESGLDNKTYYLREGNADIYSCNERYKNFKIEYGEFYSDGLLFSETTEFC